MIRQPTIGIGSFSLCIALVLFSAHPAAAGIINFNTNGEVVSIEDLIVGGKVYDVTFAPSISGAFPGNAFNFTTAGDATAAVQAVVDLFHMQVPPSINNGSNTTADFSVPYAVNGSFFDVRFSEYDPHDYVWYPASAQTFDGNNTVAIFTEQTAVPEPSALFLAFSAAAGIGVTYRRRRCAPRTA